MAKKEKVIKNESYDQIDELLNDKMFKNQHYGALSGEEIKNPLTFSTRSLMFDYQLSQNLPGERGMRVGTIARISGPFQCGKTSIGLTLAASFQKTMKNPFVLVVNAESRITLNQIKQCGVNTDKAVFRMFQCNRGDTVFDLVELLILNNPEQKEYYILIDSSDALNRTNDLDGRSYAESNKIAGGALLFSTACKRLALPIAATNSFLFVTSQERANMTSSPMGMNAGSRKTTSGGEALNFYPSWIGSVSKPWSQKFILEDPSNPKSKVIGHNVEINVSKSYDGTKKGLVTYPIKYNHGIYREMEMMNLCQAWSLLKLEGRTYTFVESFREDVKSKGFDLPLKIVGQKELNNFFDHNPLFIDIVESIFEKTLFGENRAANFTLENLVELEEVEMV